MLARGAAFALLLFSIAVWGQTNQMHDAAGSGPKPIAALEVGDRTFADVTLRSADAENVVINHSAGIKTIPILDLAYDQLKELNATSTRAQIDLSKVDPHPPSREVRKGVGEWIRLAGGVNKRMEDGNTPLIRAVMTGRIDYVKAVLYRKPDLDATNTAGNTAWKEAMLLGFPEIAAHLEKAGAKLPDVFSAAEKGEIDTLGLFLAKDPTGESLRNEQGHTLLIAAAIAGQTNAMRWLLEKGARVETTDKSGRPPLLHALDLGKLDAAMLLIEKGANVNARDSAGFTPLILAARKGDTNVLGALLERGARVQSADRNGRNPLMYAADNRHADAVKLLLEKGARPADIDREGKTAHNIATERGDSEIAAMISEAEKNFQKSRQEKQKSIERVLGGELTAQGEEQIKEAARPGLLPIVLWVGLVLGVAGYVWLVIMGFHESVVWGMLMFFLGPLAGFIYYRTKSLEAVWPLLSLLTGLLLLGVPALIFQINPVEIFLRR